MFNDTKTEFLIIGTRQQLSKVTIDSIEVGDADIKPVQEVRNLGSWFDEHMSMNVHVGKVCSKAFRGLYNIRQIRKFLSIESTKTLVHAFVTSHLDYCNSLFSFVHAAPSIWNMLPYGIRNSKTIDCFKSQLKTFLFKKAFDSNF